MKEMIATLVSESANRAVWAVRNQSTLRCQGGTWRVITYPNSDIVSLYTWVKNRPVSAVVATRLLPRAKKAIAAAIASKA